MYLHGMNDYEVNAIAESEEQRLMQETDEGTEGAKEEERPLNRFMSK